MEPKESKAKELFWREHLQKLSEYKGGQREYADVNGISHSKLSYYKCKYAAKPSFSKVTIKPQASIPTQQQTSGRPAAIFKNIDPEWLARFLKELFK